MQRVMSDKHSAADGRYREVAAHYSTAGGIGARQEELEWEVAGWQQPAVWVGCPNCLAEYVAQWVGNNGIGHLAERVRCHSFFHDSRCVLLLWLQGCIFQN